MNSIVAWVAGLSRVAKLGLAGGALVTGVAVVSPSDQPDVNPPPSVQPASLQAEQEPSVTKDTETVTQKIPFAKTTRKDSSLNEGTEYIETPGQNGELEITYTVTYADGIETDRKISSEKVTKKPIDQVTVIGTYKKPVATQKKSDCTIKGNISYRTGEKIYHLPGQSYYNSTQINTSEGERWFCSESEAINAGWRKSKR